MSPASARIRALNDAFRTAGPLWATSLGRRAPDEDDWLITDGVQSFGPLFVLEAVQAVRSFERFDDGNDPHGEQDFGSFELEGHRLLWKIDYYDRDLRLHSPDPADASLTRRVLTLMLAQEY